MILTMSLVNTLKRTAQAGLVGLVLLGQGGCECQEPKSQTSQGATKQKTQEEILAEYAKLEEEVLAVVKRYATRTPGQIRDDDSFKPWEKLRLMPQKKFSPNCSVVYSQSPIGTPLTKGPQLEFIYERDRLNEISFCYRYDNTQDCRFVATKKESNSWDIEFGKEQKKPYLMKYIDYGEKIGHPEVCYFEESGNPGDNQKLVYHSIADPDKVSYLLSLVKKFCENYKP